MCIWGDRDDHEHKMLSERIVTICSDAVTFFGGRKVHEMRWSVNFVVKHLGICQMQLVLHVGVVPDVHEIVVPRALTRYHEEAEELARQQHLDSLVVRRKRSPSDCCHDQCSACPTRNCWASACRPSASTSRA